MADTTQSAADADAPAELGSATYEIIRQRLDAQGGALREAMSALDARRREIFGSVESKLLQADRIHTAHNCVPQDMVQLGDNRFLFGFNVRFGLKQDVGIGDVFAIFARDEESGAFREEPLELLGDNRFLSDFKRLYSVYDQTTFRKFSLIEGRLFMVFQTGNSPGDIAVFQWAVERGALRYADGRAESEFRRIGFPPSHHFAWAVPDREAYRYGDHPHISILDRVFVECLSGTLTIKVEDNTATGEGVYSEPVEDKRQKVDDAEIAYAALGDLILLRIRPYKEREYRYLIFNEKLQSAVRVDSLGDSCAALPEDHGLIFPDGYYLATGELKRFPAAASGHVLERIVHSPNGEDSLFVFYSQSSGEYVLMPYRLIEQSVEERIACHGFSLFPNGHLVLLRADEQPQKHHQIQLRQTPFYETGHEPPGQREAYLYQVGNRDVVRCLAECNEVLTLLRREEPYAELYADLVRRCAQILDGYPWISHAEAFGLDAALRRVREAADRAVDEFDKVVRLRAEARRHLQAVRERCDAEFHAIRRAPLRQIDEFVRHLAALRGLTGEILTRKETRYIDTAALDELGAQVAAQTGDLSNATVQFLLEPTALDPYRAAADAHMQAVDSVKRAAEAREIESAVATTGSELEMLIEIVNGLKIDDATETTRIIDAITAIYTTLNQVRGALRNRLHDLNAAEGAAQFSAQMKLLAQSIASYLDLCDTPAKCDEYLNRISVQIEEMEGAFAEFDEYIVQIAERRTEAYEAFEQKKVALTEARNRRATALQTSADRVLKVIGNRLSGFDKVEDIHAYLASDLMITKVRETIDQLLELGDPVKADDLATRLKSLGQEAVRQLRDKQELFTTGPGVIQLGRHHFNVNTQPLDLTIVRRDDDQFVHLTGTRYFDKITTPDFVATRAVWDQEAASENPDVYRAEVLAKKFLDALAADPATDLAAIASQPESDTLAAIQAFAAPRYQEAYTRGIHDADAAQIFAALLEIRLALGLARFPSDARACAVVYWTQFCPDDARELWGSTLRGFAERNRIFPGDPVQRGYIRELERLIAGFCESTGLYAPGIAPVAAEYLFHELTSGEDFVVTREADAIASGFRQHLVTKGAEGTWESSLDALKAHPVARLHLVRDWLRGFLLGDAERLRWLEEAASVLFCGDAAPRHVVTAETVRSLSGMKGAHPRIESGTYPFDFLDFQQRLERFEREVVPEFERFQALKQSILDDERGRLRLDEFRPKVLTSFVRNQLIDRVYLPLVGDNLAKQLGTAGDNRRTDRSGLLLLVSPPGYGKTTLLEYLASRLGVVFVKINGPALGFGTTSLDPQEAPNAAAREEIEKLNLALEMGDNVLLCVDDIQHCSSEFLQKFISLCDAQRRIEGVWRGRTRTYDLRGRKVAVAMAGNPYTETGQRFRIPDMLSNRADTYNLGDIIGGNAEWFKASYIENAITSNSVLAPLANRSQHDIRVFLRMAETGEREDASFEGSYSSQEVEEVVSVLKKLIAVREVVLAVNLEYIRSAAQSDEFRTEPPFKLQGSYRNMNRLAEKVVAIMDDDEVRALILDHYRNESQTLTADTEANLLKLRELIGILTPDEQQRWDEIKTTFQRNQVARGAGGDSDPVGRVVGQLSALSAGLDAVRTSIAESGKSTASSSDSDVRSVLHELEMIHATLASLQHLSIQQRDELKSARDQLEQRAKQGVIEVELTDEMLANQQKFLDHFQHVLSSRERPEN